MHRITVSMRRASGLVSIALLALTVQAQTPDGDWTTYNRTYSGERFSPIKEINTSNVSLAVSCSLRIPSATCLPLTLAMVEYSGKKRLNRTAVAWFLTTPVGNNESHSRRV